jgi:hypothetical protein
MNTFDSLGFEVVRGAISPETAKYAAMQFDMIRDTAYFNHRVDPQDKYRFNDRQINQSFSWYSPYCMEAMAQMLQPMIEGVVGRTLWPVYSYGRIYYSGAELVKHKDRPGSEYAATICLETDPVNWSIFFEDPQGIEHELFLNPGDLCVYKGSELLHWREPYQGQKQTQGFIFFVDQFGPYQHLRYDTRPMLGLSLDTKQIKD